jgi:hypothetical protein
MRNNNNDKSLCSKHTIPDKDCKICNAENNFVQRIEMSREEKEKMYNKLTKKKLINMVIECNIVIDSLLGHPNNQSSKK